ncbi:MAG: hypothetical protein ABW193_09135, partial [Luteibacter sp.]
TVKGMLTALPLCATEKGMLANGGTGLSAHPANIPHIATVATFSFRMPRSLVERRSMPSPARLVNT